MQDFTVIEFHKSRDFSRKLNVTFEFIRQNFIGLGKSVLFIAGPPALIAGMIMGSFFKDMISLTINPSDMELLQGRLLSLSYWMEMILMMVFAVVAGVMVIATINNYLMIYGEKRTNKIEVAEVWERVRNTFWMYFRTLFSYWLMAIAVYLGMILVVVMLTAISPILAFPGFLALFCGLIYLYIASSLTFVIRAYEGTSFFTSIGRSFKLTQGKWWSTFGLTFVLTFIVIIISYVFIIPVYVVTGAAALHTTSTDTLEGPSTSMELIMIVSSTLYFLGSVILSTLPVTGIAFQYFNLVEQKEAKGLMTNIDSFGEAQAPTPTDDQY